MIRQFLTPASYLLIRLEGKWVFDLLAPFVISIIVFFLYILFSDVIVVVGDGGVVPLSINLLTALVGFFVAALAAVATFPSRVADKFMHGNGGVIFDHEVGHDVRLTRRQFLCHLFGYLSALTFLLFIICVVLMASREGFSLYVNSLSSGVALKFFLIFFYIFICCHLICVSLLGMHYLIYKLHRPEISASV